MRSRRPLRFSPIGGRPHRGPRRGRPEEFPAIRKQAKAEGATLYFADEAGICSDYHAGTTWAATWVQVGQPPVVKATGPGTA